MVQASTFVLAAFAIAPVFAAPLNPPSAEESFKRSDDSASLVERSSIDIISGESSTLVARAPEPKFSFGRLVRGGAKVASFFIRDEDGNIVEREIDLSDLSDRDFEDAELDTRAPEPKFSFGRLVRGGAKVASFFIRDEDGNVVEREIDLDDLFDRDFEDAELDTRAPEPKFSFGRLVRGGAKVASFFIRDEDGNIIEREIDLEGLSDRDIQELAEELQARDFVFDFEDSLEAREPRLRAGRALKRASDAVRKASGAVGRVGQQVGKAKNIISSAAGFVNKVSGFASGLGLREEEEGMEVREIDELD